MKKTLPFVFLRIYLILIGVFLLSVGNLHGQENVNNFKHISTSNQFSLNSVTAIGQDQRGFMWFGTRNGLIRYDGIELKNIKRVLPGNPALNANDIHGIHVDTRGDVWMATNSGLSVKAFKDSEDLNQYTGNPLPEPEFALRLMPEIPGEEKDDRKCVLVVEDNPGVGGFIYNVLADYYKVVLVENGVLGCQSALTIQPDLIISDMMMPEMDGVEFCSKVKADIRTSHIPFILLSARTSLVYKYDGLESGADDYLYKPFEIKELLLKCKNIIHTHDRLKEKYLNSGVFVPSELAVNSLDENMMNKAFSIVKENISNEFFGVEQFSEELGISRSLLFTKFKAWTNQTPNEFILSMRMKQAALMIEQNNHNVSEIGYKVGFKDPSYFTKTFKKHFQVTPKSYAEKFRAGFPVG